MEKNTKICTEVPILASCRPISIQSNRRRSISLPPPDRSLQENSAVPKCICYTYERRQALSPYHFSQCERSYPQSNPSHQFQPQLQPRISSYGQICSHPFFAPSPFGYLVGFRQDFQENARQGNRRLATAKRLVLPPGGIIKEGQFFFSNKIYVQLSLEQQVRLGAVNPGTQNKCRKIRPWLVLWKLDNGNVIVVCSTTRENKVWEGVLEKDLRSFLPISPTPEMVGRRALQLEADAEGVFAGRSLLFLEIEKEIHPNFLGDYIGEITSESLKRLKSEREEWKWPNLTVDRSHKIMHVNGHIIPSTYTTRNEEFGANLRYGNSRGVGWPPLNRRNA